MLEICVAKQLPNSDGFPRRPADRLRGGTRLPSDVLLRMAPFPHPIGRQLIARPWQDADRAIRRSGSWKTISRKKWKLVEVKLKVLSAKGLGG